MNIEEILKCILTIASGISTLIGVGLTIRSLALKIYKANVFQKRTPLPIESIGCDTLSAEVLQDLEIIKQFQKRGIPYLEEESRQLLFWLRKQINGRLTYKEIGELKDLVQLNDENKVQIILPSGHKFLTRFTIGVYIFFGIILSLTVFTIAGGYLTTIKDSYLLIYQCFLIAYIFFFLSKMYSPIYNAKKLIKIMNGKEYIYPNEK